MMEADNQKYLNTKELSQYLGVSIATIQRWRGDGVGPVYIKQGTIVRYDICDVEEWIEAHKIQRGYV